MGPDSPMEGLTIGLFTDPEGHLVGLVQGRLASASTRRRRIATPAA